jgi:hypothetical protein
MTIAPTTEPSLDLVARMDRLGVTQAFMGEYLHLSQSEISKAVNEVTDSQHTRINAALRELEEISALFYPQKLWFENAEATRSFINSPRLPNLFSLLSETQWLEVDRLNRIWAEGNRLEAEIESSELRTRDLWVKFLSESNTSGEGHEA